MNAYTSIIFISGVISLIVSYGVGCLFAKALMDVVDKHIENIYGYIALCIHAKRSGTNDRDS